MMVVKQSKAKRKEVGGIKIYFAGQKDNLANRWPGHPWRRVLSFYFRDVFMRSKMLSLALEPWEEENK
ncbi:MAG: hypothetical protein M0R49_00080 [Limnochordia bacterium]|nr:hypothetical protein [Limnochordia bacterium]